MIFGLCLVFLDINYSIYPTVKRGKIIDLFIKLIDLHAIQKMKSIYFYILALISKHDDI